MVMRKMEQRAKKPGDLRKMTQNDDKEINEEDEVNQVLEEDDHNDIDRSRTPSGKVGRNSS